MVLRSKRNFNGGGSAWSRPSRPSRPSGGGSTGGGGGGPHGGGGSDRQPGISTSNNRTGTNSQSGQSTYQSGGAGGEFGGTPTISKDSRTFKSVTDTIKSDQPYTYKTEKEIERDRKLYQSKNTVESILGSAGYLPPDPSMDAEMFQYGEFGYGPGSQWDEELKEFFGGTPQGGFSHAQLTEYLYGKGMMGIDDTMFLGGNPGQTGFGPGEKPAWYGQPRTGSTGGGGGGGGGGWGSYGGGGGGGGGYGYGGEQQPPPRGYQRAQVGPGTLQEQVNQAFLGMSGMQKKRGGIVSLLRLGS